MADIKWGTRDSKGEWKPDDPPVPSPLFSWPWRPWKVIRYLFGWQGFFLPYNALFCSLAILSWLYFTPDLSRTVTFNIDWIAEIFLRNAVLVLLLFGGLHLRLYTTRGQGEKFKYTDKWLATNNKKFLFKNQTGDNMFWSLVSGVSFWTAYESLSLWMFSNGYLPMVSFQSRPVYFILIMIAVMFLREIHFYFIHRFSHWNPLYKSAHYLHHNNINIGPWSGLSMHPMEHLLYFSGVLLHWVIPSHPLHAMFHLMHAGLAPAAGHTGFDKFVGKGERGIVVAGFFHYLHHRFFTVNYGVEIVPFDKWFGSFHDGTPEAHAEMVEKRKKLRNQGA